jgi:UTP-glucose-1-phosphate uridylyltransferase
MNELERLQRVIHGEIQLTDAINNTLSNQVCHLFLNLKNRFDCGSMEGLLAANKCFRKFV